MNVSRCIFCQIYSLIFFRYIPRNGITLFNFSRYHQTTYQSFTITVILLQQVSSSLLILTLVSRLHISSRKFLISNIVHLQFLNVLSIIFCRLKFYQKPPPLKFVFKSFLKYIINILKLFDFSMHLPRIGFQSFVLFLSHLVRFLQAFAFSIVSQLLWIKTFQKIWVILFLMQG